VAGIWLFEWVLIDLWINQGSPNFFFTSMVTFGGLANGLDDLIGVT
jgi:hypothetical protein